VDALRPAMASVPGAMLVAISSPHAKPARRTLSTRRRSERRAVCHRIPRGLASPRGRLIATGSESWR
jgi:hypothetical protein